MTLENLKSVLGCKAKDTVTGFTGIITSISIHLTGCNTYWLNPGVDKDGKLKDGNWFDDSRIELIPIEKKLKKSKKDTGAEQIGPPSRN